MTGPDTFDPLDVPCRVCDAAPRQTCLWIDRGRWTFRRPHAARVTAARSADALRREKRRA